MTDCQDTTLPADDCLQARDADTPWRWIGELTQGDPQADCPPPKRGRTGWTVTKLFDADPQISDGLAVFCLYEHLQDTLHDALGPQADLAILHPDSMSVTFAAQPEPSSRSPISEVAKRPSDLAPGPSLASLIWMPLHDQFVEQAGRPGPAAVPPGPATVHLAIVDSQVDTGSPFADDPSTSPHGYALAHMATDLICQSVSSCGVDVPTHLALAYTCTDLAGLQCTQDTLHGGWVGAIGWVATTIRDAVRQHAADGKLIINVSLGWDPLFNDTASGAERAAKRAVVAALSDAVCHGALVIASSGTTVIFARACPVSLLSLPTGTMPSRPHRVRRRRKITQTQ
jgi:hypothetical protein